MDLVSNSISYQAMTKATSDSVVAGRKFSLVLVVLLSLCTSVQTEANFTVWATRRITADIYKLNLLETHSNCGFHSKGLTRTYLVSEKQCVSDKELLNRCHSTVMSPIECSAYLISIVEDIDSQYSTIVNQNCSSKMIFVVSFGFNETNQPLNNSFCNISSLEVYRGREQAIEINHQGFYINDNGSIEIQRDQLVYETEDYKGELYRMSLFCSGGGLPESGCLFFKVNGRTNTTEDKFNGTVPGTFQYNNDTMVPKVSSDPTGESITTTTASVQSMTVIVSTTEISIFVVDGTPFYTVIGVGGGIIVLTFGFIIVCVLICFSVQRKRKSHTFTIAATLPIHNGIQTQGSEPSTYESPQPNSSERVDDRTLMPNNRRLYQPTRDTLVTGTDDNHYRTGQDRYQVHFFPTEVEHPYTHQQMEPMAENNTLEIWSNKEMKQLVSSESVQSPESQINSTLMDSKEALELSQVYDNVNHKPSEDGAAEGMVYDQLSHTVCHGKLSLPTYIGAAQEYSALGVWKDSPHTKNFLGESMPVYDAPDVKIQGQKSEIVMMPSSHKISTCSCPPLPLSTAKFRDHDLEHTYAILEQDYSQQSTRTQAAKITESEHTHTILEQDQSACAQTVKTEPGHTYAILEQDQVEGLSPNGGITSEVDMEHTYAILEQEQFLLHSTHEQTEPDCHICKKEGQTNETWTLQSPESKHERKHSTSRDTNFELVQIYTTISPKPPDHEARATEQPSHQACRKKQSLPSYLGVRPTEYSAMDIRNTPGVKKKQQRKKTKENKVPNNGEAIMMAASHKVSTTSCPPLSLFTEPVDTNNRQNPLVSGSFKQKKAHTAAAHTHN